MENCVILYTKRNLSLLKNIKVAFPQTNIKVVFCKERPYGDFSFIENKNWRIYNSSYWVWLGLQNVDSDCLILDSKCKIPEIPLVSSVYLKKTISKSKVGANLDGKNILNIDFGLPNLFSNSFYLTKNYVRAFNQLKTSIRHKYFSHEIINLMIDGGYNFEWRKL